MFAAEIEMADEHGSGVPQVCPLLGVAGGATGEPTCERAHAQGGSSRMTDGGLAEIGLLLRETQLPINKARRKFPPVQ